MFWGKGLDLVIEEEEGPYEECVEADGGHLVIERAATILQECFQGKSILKLLHQ